MKNLFGMKGAVMQSRFFFFDDSRERYVIAQRREIHFCCRVFVRSSRLLFLYFIIKLRPLARRRRLEQFSTEQYFIIELLLINFSSFIIISPALNNRPLLYIAYTTIPRGSLCIQSLTQQSIHEFRRRLPKSTIILIHTHTRARFRV